jgi:type I restriction enzyme S subunit
MKPGYKQTDLGVLPEDWEIKTLGEIGTIIRGASPRPKGDPLYYGGDVPRLMVEDVTRDGKVVFPQVDFLTKAGAKLSRPCKKGTLTIVCSGTVGVVSFLGVDACIHDGFLALIDIDKKVSDEYLYYQLSHLRENFNATATHGGVFTNLTTFGVRELSIPFPPLAEQQFISEKLGAVDALLTAQRGLLAKKRDLKQATQQALLNGKMRLPGFAGEWKEKTFGDVMTGFSSGATPYRENKHFYQGSIKWVSSGELNYSIITDTIEHISVEAMRKTNLRLLPAGTFLMAITGLEAAGTRGSCAILGTEATTNQSCMALFPGKELITEYLFHYYVLHGDALAFQYCQGTKQQSYTGTIVKRLPILLPPVDEQRAIAAILSNMDVELEALAAQVAKTQALKQGMMQDLLTGAVRLAPAAAALSTTLTPSTAA